MRPNSTPAPVRRRVALLALGSALLPQIACSQPPSSADVATLDEARQLHESGQALLVDIRESSEHATGVAAGALLLPMSQLSRRIAELPADPSRPVLLICRTQNRSSNTLKALRRQGFGHVRYVHGGMSDWARRGWPMVKPAATTPGPTHSGGG
ncbi:MAG: rhodanese-like domain-containing protein [Rubrivivax sp.]|nr:rhodanese-like domain-containing protein [Rubrivivax sp.]